MKIVNPKASLVAMEDYSHTELMETCGRLCYKSEDKITPGSAEKFIDFAFKKKHGSVTEFAVFTLAINASIENIDSLMRTEQKYLIIDNMSEAIGEILVTGTVRAWREAFKRHPENFILRQSIRFLKKQSPILFQGLDPLQDLTGGHFIVNVISAAELDLMFIPRIKARHRFAMIWWTVSRAVSHELVRHRPVSWLQESQRYCRYSDDKFGSEVSFIEPGGAFPVLLRTSLENNNHVERRSHWLNQMQRAEFAYLDMLRLGSSPQEARLVLPNSCKTELVMMATLEEFQIFFGLRLPKTAEPSMREVTHMVYPEFNRKWPLLFQPLEYCI